jgi:arginyl-tRNA synthetase
MRITILELVAAAVKTLGLTADRIEITRPEEEFGDYATNVALQLAGKNGGKPRDIAQKIADELGKEPDIAEAIVAGPGFINIRVHSNVLATRLEQAVKDAPRGIYGASNLGQGKTVLNEFPSPNLAKPYSVGHRRPALQGWAVMKLMQLHGYNTVTDNHIGDYGTPFGKWVVGFLRHSSDEVLEKEGIRELARLYIEITRELKAEKAEEKHVLADEVQEWLQKLGASDPQALAYAERFRRISLDHMHGVLKRLGITTEHELGESFYVKRAHELVDELLDKGIAEVSDGAVIVRLDEYGIETPIMVRKANGAVLYATTDLATIEYRQKTWKPEMVFVHTGQEQAFYFRQLKALAQKVGYTDVLLHLWHGLIDQKNEDGTREKMSSRRGVVLLEDLINEAEDRIAKLMTTQSSEDISAVAIGAIKFADFAAERHKGLLFDWDTALNLHGFSGPAVQYAAVRVQSILDKAGKLPTQLVEGYDWQAEHRLLLQLHDFPHLLLELHTDYQLHQLAGYIYDVAKELNRYYEETSVLSSREPDRSNRLWLLAVVKAVLTTGLDTLGIAIPRAM